MNDLRIAIIGCGRIARAHLEAVAKTPALQLVAVSDVDFKAAQALAQALAHEGGAQAFQNHAELLQTRPDIAIICTPPTTHAAIVCDALRAGAHVLCEKPLGVAPHEIESMNREAARCGRVLMMASKFRFVPRLQEVRARIASGELGDLVCYRNAFVSRVEMNGRMNAQRDLAGGGALMDNGPHAFDVARFLLGSISDVEARFLPALQNLEVEDGVQLCFACQNHPNLRGEILLSWSAHAATPFFIEVMGTRGGAAIGWHDYDKNAAFAAQMQHFADAARGEIEPMISPDDALCNARSIAAAYLSAQRV